FTSDSILFLTIKSDEFRTVIVYINKDIRAWLFTSNNTIKTWIFRCFLAEKVKKKLFITKALFFIHIFYNFAISTNGFLIII
ncbi:hypothetical protein DL98DRAFT_438346, partial [Cadophora sp. DSE1049]